MHNGAEPRWSNRRLWLLAAACILAAIAIMGVVVYLSSADSATTTAVPSTSSVPPPRTTTITRTTTISAPPAVVEETTPAEEPVIETATETPAAPEPYEGQPCEVDRFNEHSPDGTLYCSAMNGAWTDLTNQSRSAVEQGSSCNEPGARARVARTDGIATCKAGPDGLLGWYW